MNKTMSFRASEPSRVTSADRALVGDGTYRVLATLEFRRCSYRVFADLNIDDGSAGLRVLRFDLPASGEWLMERAITIPIVWPDFAPLEHPVNGADFVLRVPVRLDESQAALFFGPSGPPAI
jgi:hypothetical protein